MHLVRHPDLVAPCVAVGLIVNENQQTTKVARVGVIGAGMMGQGIAHACAIAGIDVVVTDTSAEKAGAAIAYTEKLLDKIPPKTMSDGEKASILKRITASDDFAVLAECDLVIESVDEDAAVKREVIGKAASVLGASAILATNTSSLPVSRLAEAMEKPERFIGLHFFSPAEKMPLVEIACSDSTSDETLARAFDFARQLGKTPIVVNDSPGFFTTRVFNTYIDEGCRLVKEGIDPVFVENMGRYVGMPVGPLAIHDEIGQELVRRITRSHESLGVEPRSDASAAAELAEKLVIDHGRGGRNRGGGFYEYPAEGGKYIWPPLIEEYRKESAEISEQDTRDRLLFRQVIESLKCLEEGVLRSVPDGNIGSLMGIAAPTWTGGLIQFVNTYGLQRFIDRCEELAAGYGERFRAPAIVGEKLKAGELFE